MTQPVYVFNDDARYFVVNYHTLGDQDKKAHLATLWKTFNRYDPALGQTYKIWYRPTSPELEVSVDYLLPPKSPAGRYRIETFIPAKNSNSRKAIFSITHNLYQVNGQTNEENALVVVDMLDLKDVWHTLGEFYLDPSLGAAIGRVRQYDLSLEDPPVEVSFGPVRWVPLFTLTGKRARFDSPVGTLPERNASFPAGRVIFGKYPIWVGSWFDANPFLTWYFNGYHTGSDLNLPGSSQADQGKEIFSIGDGTVTYAGKAGTWGNIIVIEHPDALVRLPDGRSRRQKVYSRYGHVDDRIQVRRGQEVSRGTLVGYIGLAANATAGWHLHFDICYTDLLGTRPSHWPNMEIIRAIRMSAGSNNPRAYEGSKAAIMREVVSNYVDPFRFIQDNHG
ncbi:MAG: M23 family metallopeptidase [Anaerolineales bacterium]|nr:M23 family metallopeptidase [Anaerolineales bacterium]